MSSANARHVGLQRAAAGAAAAAALCLGLVGCQPEPVPTSAPTPSASASASPSPSPTGSPSPTETAQAGEEIALPTACEQLYSPAMLAALQQRVPLNDPGITMTSTQNVGALEILTSGIPTLRCTWGAPSETGLATNVSIVDPAQSAAVVGCPGRVRFHVRTHRRRNGVPFRADRDHSGRRPGVAHRDARPARERVGVDRDGRLRGRGLLRRHRRDALGLNPARFR